MGFTLDDLPTSHLSEAALRKLLGGVIDLNVMRNYIKAVSAAATAPPVINHAIGIPKLGLAPEAICPVCIQAKSHQQSVNRQPSPRAAAPYVLVFIDDWKGPCPSVTGAQHVFGVVDSYTGMKVGITMRTKDEAVRAVHQLHAAVLGIGYAIQRIRADRSAVNTGSPFRQARADLNIALQFTASDSHHQAGLAERSFRTIGECAQPMLFHAGLDRTFWDWEYFHAVYLSNRQRSSSVNAIPYTLMTGRKPDLTDLHVFGCVASVNIPVTMRAAKGKMTPKSWPGIYVGHH
eukprot:jgi/Tetstr1/445120/TSEL_032918.t1